MAMSSYLSGTFFENLLKNVFLEYDIKKYAKIWKIGGDNIKNKYVKKEKLPPDFIGYTLKYNKQWLPTPLPLMVEAKHCGTKKFTMKNIKIHQLENLHSINSYGGIGLLVIGMPKLCKCICIRVDTNFYQYCLARNNGMVLSGYANLEELTSFDHSMFEYNQIKHTIDPLLVID